MNIITRTINNLQYAHYRKLRDKALNKMREHEGDPCDREWKKWANVALKCFSKCDEIPLK